MVIFVTLLTYSGATTAETATDLAPKKFLQVEAKTRVQTGSVHYGNFDYDDSTSSPFADFIIGIIFISFSFPILWNNERKQVKIEHLLNNGEKKCQDCKDLTNPTDEQNFKLIYVSGETKN